MKDDSNSKSSLPVVENLFFEEEKNIVSRQEWKRFIRSYERIRKASHNGVLPFDPRFNAVHWAFDVSSLCREIVFGYCWMNAYAKYYRQRVPRNSEPAHVDFHVSYFANNCITRINSCRDKIALMVWAFYCPFNPENKDEVLDYTRIVERFKYPIKFGITLKNHDILLTSLERLEGRDFNRIQKCRHFKIHRMEPRIEIYGVANHHGWDYMLPLFNPKDIRKFDRELSKQYPDKQFRERIKKGCYKNGVLFDTRRIKDSIWDFEELEGHIKSCSLKLLITSSECFQILSNRAPLKKRHNNATAPDCEKRRGLDGQGFGRGR